MDEYNTDDLQCQKNAKRPRPISPTELKKTIVLDEGLLDSLTEQINIVLRLGKRVWYLPRFRGIDYENYELVFNKLIENYTKVGWKVNRITERRPDGLSYLIFEE